MTPADRTPVVTLSMAPRCVNPRCGRDMADAHARLREGEAWMACAARGTGRALAGSLPCGQRWVARVLLPGTDGAELRRLLGGALAAAVVRATLPEYRTRPDSELWRVTLVPLDPDARAWLQVPVTADVEHRFRFRPLVSVLRAMGYAAAA